MSTEALLLAWSRDRDEAAFEALFRGHYDAIYRALYRMVGDEADDVAQEVFLRLHDRPPRGGEAEIRAWLYRVATRLGYNALRARRRLEKRRDRLAASTDGVGWAQAVPDPATELERDQAQFGVRQALALLNQRQAAILTLRYSGLSYREIAQALEMAPGSVGTLLARAEAAFARAYRSLVGEEA
ncbi:MAG: sigma-70 family RNA polymerase sigma factor [Anaerolineae bacterium]|nr:sigma-70 family RNA polymerase sigma factor [Anaerolineae bacterium]